jgi:hypothetical protein
MTLDLVVCSSGVDHLGVLFGVYVHAFILLRKRPVAKEPAVEPVIIALQLSASMKYAAALTHTKFNATENKKTNVNFGQSMFMLIVCLHFYLIHCTRPRTILKLNLASC